MRVQSESRVASGSRAREQYAALPWRMTNGALEILLITTLRTHRWIVPKGWPIAALSPSACAAREALEEAGVDGAICEKPLGAFRYTKERKDGANVPCRVEVFALEVTGRRRSWAEKGVRESRWCSVPECLERVSEPSLRQLIVKFAQSMQAKH